MSKESEKQALIIALLNINRELLNRGIKYSYGAEVSNGKTCVYIYAGSFEVNGAKLRLIAEGSPLECQARVYASAFHGDNFYG